uniref:Uncharacterized protein n=1 Tax=Anguilla anguilla TaxID=7936 RepID=A0A0E9QGV2_ANGAN
MIFSRLYINVLEQSVPEQSVFSTTHGSSSHSIHAMKLHDLFTAIPHSSKL